MTNSDRWLSATDPYTLLEMFSDKLSPRRFRLFACACCRDIWPLLTDERSRRAVEVAERFADGLGSVRELDAARTAAWAVVWEAWAVDAAAGSAARAAAWVVARAVARAVDADSWEAARAAAWVAGVSEAGAGAMAAIVGEKEHRQADLLRDIFGNPFRPVTLNRRWRSSIVLDIARTTYDQRTYDALPILGDALMDAGCDNDEIVKHCQGPWPHVRGCWVVDLILEKPI